MVGWVKYGLDCWMIEEEGKCRAEAEARGLPEEKKGMGKGNRNEKGEQEDEREEKLEARPKVEKIQ